MWIIILTKSFLLFQSSSTVPSMTRIPFPILGMVVFLRFALENSDARWFSQRKREENVCASIICKWLINSHPLYVICNTSQKSLIFTFQINYTLNTLRKTVIIVYWQYWYYISHHLVFTHKSRRVKF